MRRSWDAGWTHAVLEPLRQADVFVNLDVPRIAGCDQHLQVEGQARKLPFGWRPIHARALDRSVQRAFKCTRTRMRVPVSPSSYDPHSACWAAQGNQHGQPRGTNTSRTSTHLAACTGCRQRRLPFCPVSQAVAALVVRRRPRGAEALHCKGGDLQCKWL